MGTHYENKPSPPSQFIWKNVTTCLLLMNFPHRIHFQPSQKAHAKRTTNHIYCYQGQCLATLLDVSQNTLPSCTPPILHSTIQAIPPQANQEIPSILPVLLSVLDRMGSASRQDSRETHTHTPPPLKSRKKRIANSPTKNEPKSTTQRMNPKVQPKPQRVHASPTAQ